MGLALVREIVGEVDGGHAASTEFTLDGVAVGEGGGEALRNVCHVARRCDFADGCARLAEVGLPLGALAQNRPLWRGGPLRYPKLQRGS